MDRRTVAWLVVLSLALASACAAQAPPKGEVAVGPPALDELLARLKDADPKARAKAIEALEASDDARVVEPLIKMLDDPAEEVRRAAIVALGRVGDERAVEPLMAKAAREKFSFESVVAVSALAAIGKPAVPAALEALKSPDRARRCAAVQVLTLIGPPDAPIETALVPVLADKDDRVRRVCYESLARLGPKAAGLVPLLEKTVDDPDAYTAIQRLRALVLITGKGKPYTERLAGFLFSPDVSTRHGAGYALMTCGPAARDCWPELVRALKDEDPDVRGIVCGVLCRTGADDEPVIDALLDRLKNDTSLRVRQSAAGALGETGAKAKRAQAALEAAIQPGENCALFVCALGKVGGLDALPVLLKTCDSDSRELRWEAVAQIAALASEHPEARRVLKDLANHPREDVREAAANGPWGDKDEDYYRGLYAAYKGLVLNAFKAGDKDALAKLSDRFNDSAGGALRWVMVWKEGRMGRSELMLSKEFGERLGFAAAIHHAYSSRPHVTNLGDAVQVETNQSPGEHGRGYADGVIIHMGFRPPEREDVARGEAVDGLVVSIPAGATKFVAGAPMPVKWSIKNVGDVERTIMWHYLTDRPVFFQVGRKGGAKFLRGMRAWAPGDKMIEGPETILLKPGEAKEEEFDLARFFWDNPSPGVYEVGAVYAPKANGLLRQYLALPDFKDAAASRVDSKPIEIEILPAGTKP